MIANCRLLRKSGERFVDSRTGLSNRNVGAGMPASYVTARAPRRRALSAIALAVAAPSLAAAFAAGRRSVSGRAGEFSTKFGGRRKSRPGLVPTALSADANYDGDGDGADSDEEAELPPPTIYGFDLDDDGVDLTRDEVQSMTVAQLKQQLRLRGKKVSGKKVELVERLLEKEFSASTSENDVVGQRNGYSKYDKPINSRTVSSDDDGQSSNNRQKKDSERVAEARARGADVVDVSNFVDAEEVGRSFRSSDRRRSIDDDDSIDVEAKRDDVAGSEGEVSSSPEVWGEDARIVEDYEGRSLVVDGLSRTVVEFTGSNNKVVQAYVVGSRDSLSNFLRGGDAAKKQKRQRKESNDEKKTEKPTYSSMEEEVYAIQKRREQESKRGLIRTDEAEGTEDAADPGAAYSTIERDYGDWGVYTPTGAQLSSSEVQGVLLLSDVFGPFTVNTQALADKIAFECQPAVVMVPDLFRGKPWTKNATLGDDGVERNGDGESYEEWRATHPERRVDVDIRAAAAVLRRRYAVSSIAVWGTCYGGGRALEAAAGWYAGGPDSYYADAWGDRPAPPHVDPIAAVAWYPTRYDARRLFGRENEGFRTFEGGGDRRVAVMAVFGGEDALPGATPEDARLLRECLEEDPRIKDYMVKVFPGQGHGFAHGNLGMEGVAGEEDVCDSERFAGEDFGSVAQPSMIGEGGGDAEVACLLSTAWMETYSRVFLPTAGTPVRHDADRRWSALEMDRGEGKSPSEIRAELDEAILQHEDAEVDLRRMARSGSPLLEEGGPGGEAFKNLEDERERIRRKILEEYDIREDDNEETFNRKFERARRDGALDKLLLDAYMDDSGDAYW